MFFFETRCRIPQHRCRIPTKKVSHSKYFDEQLERIREIRASERKFYQKITDLYATAIDYDKNAATTRRFYATVQNKMHYAVHGHTASELLSFLPHRFVETCPVPHRFAGTYQ